MAWVGKIPWRRKWQPTPVLLPGESHGGRSLVGYSPGGRKESNTTEQLHFTSLYTTWHMRSSFPCSGIDPTPPEMQAQILNHYQGSPSPLVCLSDVKRLIR